MCFLQTLILNYFFSHYNSLEGNKVSQIVTHLKLSGWGRFEGLGWKLTFLNCCKKLRGQRTYMPFAYRRQYVRQQEVVTYSSKRRTHCVNRRIWNTVQGNVKSDCLESKLHNSIRFFFPIYNSNSTCSAGVFV